MSEPMTTEQQFFYDEAGYSYGMNETPEEGRRRGAAVLAAAERAINKFNWHVNWINGDDCIGCDCGTDCKCCTGEPHDCYQAVLKDEEGKYLASLGSICEPSWNYRRVIEANLAAEYIHENQINVKA
jgi:hypothetical protein